MTYVRPSRHVTVEIPAGCQPEHLVTALRGTTLYYRCCVQGALGEPVDAGSVFWKHADDVRLSCEGCAVSLASWKGYQAYARALLRDMGTGEAEAADAYEAVELSGPFATPGEGAAAEISAVVAKQEAESRGRHRPPAVPPGQPQSKEQGKQRHQETPTALYDLADS